MATPLRLERVPHKDKKHQDILVYRNTETGEEAEIPLLDIVLKGSAEAAWPDYCPPDRNRE